MSSRSTNAGFRTKSLEIILVQANVRRYFLGRKPARRRWLEVVQILAGFRFVAEPLDWLTLYNCSPSTRQKLFSYEPVDLLLVVDCIYHPSLLPALVGTIDHLATPDRTAVFVMVELRAEDVVREFLELWLAAGGGGVWEVWHVNGLLEGPYAMWVGWKRS